MDSSKRTARIVGALFIAATVASLLGTSLTSSVVGAPDYLVQIAASKNLIVLGVLFKLVAAASSAGIAIALYPVLRKHNEGLALGSVGFRLLEAAFYTVSTLGLLSLLSLGQQAAGAGPQVASALQTLGTSLVALRGWAGFVIGVIFFCVGASMYYYVLYRSRLVPRWLSGWGLVAIVSLFSMVLLVAFGENPSGPEGMQLLLALPIFLQEIVLSVWLLVKGFNPSAIASGRDTECER